MCHKLEGNLSQIEHFSNFATLPGKAVTCYQ